jgi:ADP-ribose pyrophosphatase YjhB (NUDIX family)
MKDYSVHGVIFNKTKTKVFLIKRTDFPVWTTTGGGIDGNETPEQALVREIKEESNFIVKLSKQLIKYKIVDKNSNHIHTLYLYTASKVGGRYRPEYKGNQGRWFTIDKLPRSMTKSTKTRIKHALNFTKNSKKVCILPKDTAFNNFHLFALNPVTTTLIFFKKIFWRYGK